MAAGLAATALLVRAQTRRAEAQHPPAGRFIEVCGVRLHYIEKGLGVPVLLIHGTGVTAEDYVASGIVDRLAERYRVIAFDRPGYGYSERPGKGWSARAQAELLQEACGALGIDRAIVVGHSWGTLVALEMARLRPDLFAAYVGTGLFVHRDDGRTIVYERVLARAREQGLGAAVAELEAIPATVRACGRRSNAESLDQ